MKTGDIISYTFYSDQRVLKIVDVDTNKKVLKNKVVTEVMYKIENMSIDPLLPENIRERVRFFMMSAESLKKLINDNNATLKVND